MPDPSMIERIARVCAIWADHHDPDAWRAYQGVARLILAELREPTEEMTIGMYSVLQGGAGLLGSWRAAINAALAEPDQTKPE